MSATTPKADLAMLLDAVTAAGRIAMAYFGSSSLDVAMKNGVSPVTDADYAVDKYLRETLLDARPEYGWLSEETKDDTPEKRIAAPRTFIVDPIDGTRAFINGDDVWCISAAIVENGRPIAGAVHCPVRRETFSASIGDGAMLNGAPLKPVSGHEPPVIAIPKSLKLEVGRLLGRPIETHPHVPSLAYRLIMVADGRLDGTFVRPNSHEWDLAAADLIAKEAGAALLDADGSPLTYNRRDPRQNGLVAARNPLLDEMLGVVAPKRIG